MNGLTRRQLWLWSGAPLLWSAGATAWSSGREAAEAAPGARLISLSGGMTETLWALGAASLVVATDTTSNWPVDARRTPKVGYMRQLSAEGVLALRPSAVLGTHEVGPPGVLDQLRQAGITLLLVQASHRFDEVLDKVRVAAQASGRDTAGRELARQLQAEWDGVRRDVAQARGRTAPRALFVMAHGGRAMSAGPGTAAHAMLTSAGASNVLQGAPGYKSLSAEAVAHARPEVIVTTQDSVDASGGVEGFWQQPGLAMTPAGRRRALRVYDTQALLGFGPRMPRSVRQLHQDLT